MGFNLVPRIPVESFRIVPDRVFNKSEPHDEHDLEDNCVVEGVTYRLLKFDFILMNIGDTDFVAGSPKSRPDLFIASGAHGHWHLKNFNTYKLVDSFGKNAIPSLKQAFCVLDMIPPRGKEEAEARFTNCRNETDIQGISAGWADVYRNTVPCQYIVLTGAIAKHGENAPLQNVNVQDGEYILEVETNPIHDEEPFKGKRYFEEDNYNDNTMKVRLEISGNNVSVIGGMLS